MELERKILEQRVINKHHAQSQMTLSHEYRTPLQNCILLLEDIVNFDKQQGKKKQKTKENQKQRSAAKTKMLRLVIK